MKRSFHATSIGLLSSSTAGLNLRETMTAITADHSNIEQTNQNIENETGQIVASAHEDEVTGSVLGGQEAE